MCNPWIGAVPVKNLFVELEASLSKSKSQSRGCPRRTHWPRRATASMPSFLKSMRNVFWGRGDLQERGATAEDLGAGHGDASGGVDGLLALSRPQAMATSPAKAGGGAARARAVLSPLHDSNTPQQSPMDEDGTAPSKDPPMVFYK